MGCDSRTHGFLASDVARASLEKTFTLIYASKFLVRMPFEEIFGLMTNDILEFSCENEDFL